MMAVRLRDRIVARTVELFSHAPYPLRETLRCRGDPGLFGPESATWPIVGDVAAFVAGIRALVVQAAHPEVLAGVARHSRYRTDPLGRLSRTSAYITATAYGAMPEVEAAIAAVRRAHLPVRGSSDRGRPYAADDPELAAWVHNVLVDSFVVAYREFGPEPLPEDVADRYVAEQRTVGRLLDADPLPATAAELAAWIVEHPEPAPSPPLAETIAFLRSPPLPASVRIPYRILYEAAVTTVPPELRSLLGIRVQPGARLAGRTLVDALRWALGASPSWYLALRRVGAEIPPGRFRARRIEAVDATVA